MPKAPSDSDPLPTRRQLLHRIAVLEAKVEDLEALAPNRLGPKPNAPIEWPPYDPPAPIVDLTRCQTCGARYADMTHCVCFNDRCPGRVTFTC